MRTESAQYRIDDKVIPFMLGIAVLFLALMAFRFKNDEPCKSAQFVFYTLNNDNVAYEHELVYFTAQTKNGVSSKWEWDFGDKTTDKTSGPDVTHEYNAPGEYTVRLTINGKCSEVRNISIARREKREGKLYLRPSWPETDKLQTGIPYNFSDSTIGAVSWTWYFENAEVKRVKQTTTYQFNEPGEQKVILVVNGKSGSGQIEKTFMVEDPPEVEPQKPDVTIDEIRRNYNSSPPPPPTDPPVMEENGKSIPELYQDENKPPALADGFLNSYILDINGNGGNALKKYLKNGSLSNCIIIFNGHPINPEQLRENIRAHIEHPKSLVAKQEVDARENYIKVITITAEMEPIERLIGKDRQRKYPN